jgi:hypothetical protein
MVDREERVFFQIREKRRVDGKDWSVLEDVRLCCVKMVNSAGGGLAFILLPVSDGAGLEICWSVGKSISANSAQWSRPLSVLIGVLGGTSISPNLCPHCAHHEPNIWPFFNFI